MSRFDVYANPAGSERKHTPYFVGVQNDFVDALGSRVMVPLRRETAFGPRARNLNPVLKVGADSLVPDTAALGAVPLAELRSRVATLHADRHSIHEALDTFFGGF
jgi:toxin CcdB